jgi:hypothetical protein
MRNAISRRASNLRKSAKLPVSRRSVRVTAERTHPSGDTVIDTKSKTMGADSDVQKDRETSASSGI